MRIRTLLGDKAVGAIAALVALALYLGAIAHFRSGHSTYQRFSSGPSAHVRYEQAAVVTVERQDLRRDLATGLDLGLQVVKLKILTGEHRGETLTVRNTLGYAGNVKVSPGDAVVVCVDAADAANYNVWIYSHDREPFLYGFAGLFIALLCVVGGGRGIRSVLGIVFTVSGIAFLFIPMLYRGYSPAWAAVEVSILTICVSLLLLGGFSAKTLSAILGCLGGVLSSVITLIVALGVTHLSGFNTAESDALIQISGATGMKVGELLFAAILVSSVGAIMDVAISIASAVNEVHASNPALRAAALFRSGMNVGRDMMGTMANTLIVAFTGTGLNLLVLLHSMQVTYRQVLNNNSIDIYVIQSLAGSICVVLTVPLVAVISAWLLPALHRSRSSASRLASESYQGATPQAQLR